MTVLGTSSGTVALGEGVTKMILDSRDNFSASDNVPTSALEGLIGIPGQKIAKDNTGLSRSIPSLAEGIFIFKADLPEAIAETSKGIDKLDKIATFVNTGITVNDIVNQGKRVQMENEEQQANANH